MEHRFWELPRPSQRGGLDCLKMNNRKVPDPKFGEVVIAVKAVSLNTRDIAISMNQYPLYLKDSRLIPLSDCSGAIFKVGEGVQGFKENDRVIVAFSASHFKGPSPTAEEVKTGFGGGIDGFLSEYVCVPATALIHLPDGISYEQGATLPCAASTAWNCIYGLSEYGVTPGSTVLCQGTGSVSIFALQFALAAGAQCIITSSSHLKLAELLQNVDESQRKRIKTINYQENQEWSETVLEMTNGYGVDVVVDVGGKGTFRQAVKSVKYGGLVSNIGSLDSTGPLDEDFSKLIRRKGVLYRGILIGSKEHLSKVIQCISINRIQPLVGKIFTFEKALEAYEYQAKSMHVGKVIIVL